MRRTEQLLKQIRRITENEKLGTSDGILDEEMVEHLNDAQEDILDSIYLLDTDILTKQTTFPAVPGQSTYDLPFDLFSDSHIVTVEFTTGSDSFYQEIKPAPLKERDSIPGYPSRYHIIGRTYEEVDFVWQNKGGIVFSSVPNINGTFRITYKPRLPRIELAKGDIDFVNTDGDGYVDDITLVAFDNEFNPVGLDNSNNNYSEHSFFCTWDPISRRITNRGLQFREYDTSATTATTIDPVYQSGLSPHATAGGDWILMGEYSTNVSMLPDICEKYLRAYTIWKMFKRDSSDDSKEQAQELDAMKSSILDVLAEKSSDIIDIPVLDDSWFY